MDKIDLLNSYDVLTVARRWRHANIVALDQAQRLTSTEAVKAEVALLRARSEILRGREQVLDLVSYLGLVVMVPWVLCGMLLTVGQLELVARFDPLLMGPGMRWFPIFGMFFWMVFASFSADCAGGQKDISKQLALLEPLTASPECETAMVYVDAGSPEVLAWRNIALYDRKALYHFDVEVLRALHNVVLVERPESEKAAAAEDAYRQLYGNTSTAPAVTEVAK